MDAVVSRRSFLKGAAAAALAAACPALLTGCGDESFSLGGFRVRVEEPCCNDAESRIELRVLLRGEGEAEYAEAFAAFADDTELELVNASSKIAVLHGIRGSYKPMFAVEDAALYQRLKRGEALFTFRITLSGQTAELAFDLGAGTVRLQAP